MSKTFWRDTWHLVWWRHSTLCSSFNNTSYVRYRIIVYLATLFTELCGKLFPSTLYFFFSNNIYLISIRHFFSETLFYPSDKKYFFRRPILIAFNLLINFSAVFSFRKYGRLLLFFLLLLKSSLNWLCFRQ